MVPAEPVDQIDAAEPPPVQRMARLVEVDRRAPADRVRRAEEVHDLARVDAALLAKVGFAGAFKDGD
jgi:hypothetical protein